MSFYGSLFKIALPIILQNFLSSFVNMIDTVMVGQLGYEEIAAVGLANQIFFVMNMVMFGVISGGSIFITQFWGKKDLKGVHKTIGITLVASFFVSVVFFIAARFFPHLCLRIYSSDSVVILKGSEYLRAVAPGYLFIGISFAFGNAQRSTEKVTLPMVSVGVSAILNCILNYLFIFGVTYKTGTLIPAMGIVGAAYATVFSRFIELLIVVIVMYARKYPIAVAPANYFKGIDIGFLSYYVKICIPVLINETLWGFGASLQSSVFAHSGTDVIAAFNITNTISNLIWTFFIGCGNGIAIIIGKTIGEGKMDEARSLAKRFVKFMGFSGAGLGILLIPLALSLSLLFNVEDHVIRMAQVFLFIATAMYPISAICMCMIVGVCRSGGDTVYCLFMDIGTMWIFSLPLGFLAVLVFHWPFWLVYLCIRSEDIGKITMGLLRLHSGKWLHDVTGR